MISHDVQDLFIMHWDSSFATTSFYRNPRPFIPMTAEFPKQLHQRLCSFKWKKRTEKQKQNNYVYSEDATKRERKLEKICNSNPDSLSFCSEDPPKLLYPPQKIRIDWVGVYTSPEKKIF